MNLEASKPFLHIWLKRAAYCCTGLLLLLFVLLVTAFIALPNSPARLEFVIEELASAVLNRDLKIGELVEADLNWDTYLLARNVKLSNADWADAPDFLTVERVVVRINLPSIWKDGPILISDLELSGLHLSLLAPEAHAPNWEFWPRDTEAESEDDETGSDNTLDLAFPIIIGEGHLNNAKIAYRDQDQDLSVSIANFTIQDPHSGLMTNLDLEGDINDVPMQLKGQIGPTASLLTQRNFNLDLSLSLGELSLEGSGHIDNLANFSGTDLHLLFSAPGSRELLDILGMPEVRDGPLQFDAHITDAQPGVQVDLVATLEKFALQLKGTLVNPAAMDGVSMTFNFAGPSMAEFGAMFDLQDLPELPYEVSGKISRNGTDLALREGLIEAGKDRLAVNGRLPNFPEIDDWDVAIAGKGFTLSMLGPLIGAEGLPALPYDIKGTLGSTEAGVELVDLAIESTDVSMILNGVVGEAPGFQDSQIRLTVSGQSLASSGLWLGINDLPELAFQASGELSLEDPGWQLHNAVFTTSGLQIGLEATFDSLPESTSLEAQFSLTSPDFSGALKTYGFEFEKLPGFPISADGKLSGSFNKLKVDRTTIVSGDSRLTISGVVENLSSAEGKIELRGPSSSKFAKLLGAEVAMLDAPFRLRTDISLTPDRLRLDPIALEWGKSKHDGSANIRLGDVPVVHADLHSTYVSLPFLLPNIEELETAAEVHPPSKDKTGELPPPRKLEKADLAERVIPDTVLDFRWMNDIQANIKYQFDEIYLSDEATTSAMVDVSIADGVLSSRQLSWDGTLSRGNADISLRALENTNELHVSFNAAHLPSLLFFGGKPDHQPGTFFRAKIKATGNSPRALAKSMNGALIFKAGGGSLDNQNLDLILGDTLDVIFSTLIPASDTDANTRIICHAGALAILDGKVALSPGLVLRTAKFDISTAGKINLHNEKLDLTFLNRARKGIGVSVSEVVTPYLTIAGTLANPHLELDVISATAASYVVTATMGLSILVEELWERWTQAPAMDPCERLIDGISKGNQEAYKSLLAVPAI